MKKLVFRKLFAVILCFLSPYQYAAASGASGENVFEFLKIPTTASQAALAQMTGFSSNSGAHCHAMLAFSQENSLSASYAVYFQNTSFNAVNFILAKEKCVFNFSYAGFYYGEMEKYVENGNDYVYSGKFGANDLALSAGIGFSIFDELSVGGGLKYVSQNIDGQTIMGVAANVSAIYLPDDYWYVTGGLENFGPNVEGYPMPANIYAGVYSFYNKLNVLCGVEIKYYTDGAAFIKAAGEFDWEEKIFLRAGYSFALTKSNEALGDWHERNLSLGFGVYYRPFSIDYAWLPFGELGSVNMVTLTVNF
jgi:hypothetical protein